ncbi:MAG: hypothetical protein E7493_01035 [Ruminococcus albus]|nr:hypothetical protein [Ruminococcus albus]
MSQAAENKYSPKKLIKTFVFAAILFWVGILPTLILSGGRYVIGSDYNAQMIPFSMHYYELFHNGMPEFDWKMDMGMGTVPGFSFYNLFGPYTLLSLIFPAAFMPYLITLLNGIKFGVMALGAHLYSARYVKKADTAFICGMLYAFSGFMVTNLIFHFIDIISLFPLVMFCFDRLLYERRGVAFAIMLAVTGMTNYYTFFSICVFLLLYFMVKLFCKEIKIDAKLFSMLALETLCGVLMTAVVLLPAVMSLKGNNRAGDLIFDHNLLAYEESGTVLRIIQSLFLPPEQGCGLFFSQFELNFSTCTLFIPLFGIIGAASEFLHNRKSWYSRLMAICAVIAVVPLLNSVFSAFNAHYYARWFFMPILIMVMMTGRYTEDLENREIKTGIKIWLGAVAMFIAYAVYLILSTETYKDYVSLYTGVLSYALICAGALYVIRYRDNKRLNAKKLSRIVCGFCAGILLFNTVSVSATMLWEDADMESLINYNDGIAPDTEDDSEFYRVIADVTRLTESTNVPLYWGYPQMELFNSCVPAETTDFYSKLDQVREQGAVSKYDEQYSLYSLTSVKYDILCNVPNQGGVEVEPEHVKMLRKGFELKNVCGHYVIYENTNFVPMGFAYDYYLPETDFPDVVDDGTYDSDEITRRENLCMKALMLTEEQINKYSGIMQKLPDDLAGDTSYETYVKDCQARRERAAYEFVPDEKGFTSKINAVKDELVFYSVPWNDGFTAYVDGNETEIEKVFGGLCAVFVPKGDHTVRFDYSTPGLRTGMKISICASSVLAVYTMCCIVFGVRRRKGKK